jgi:hypothetical protein
MGVVCGDLDGDGRLDVAVTNFYPDMRLLSYCLFGVPLGWRPERTRSRVIGNKCAV